MVCCIQRAVALVRRMYYLKGPTSILEVDLLSFKDLEWAPVGGDLFLIPKQGERETETRRPSKGWCWCDGPPRRRPTPPTKGAEAGDPFMSYSTREPLDHQLFCPMHAYIRHARGRRRRLYSSSSLSFFWHTCWKRILITGGNAAQRQESKSLIGSRIRSTISIG